jgi:prepilin-type N-terminal cleavage/methylation domain-containing protein
MDIDMKLLKNNKGFNPIKSGFTLIELLIVIGILTVLLAITLVAINPARQFAQANNTQRQSNVNAILNAVHEYAADHKGSLPTGITSSIKTITSTAGVSNVDLCSLLVPTYIADIPVDPTAGTKTPTGSLCTDAGATYASGYMITASGSASRVTITAPSAELGTTISITR